MLECQWALEGSISFLCCAGQFKRCREQQEVVCITQSSTGRCDCCRFLGIFLTSGYTCAHAHTHTRLDKHQNSIFTVLTVFAQYVTNSRNADQMWPATSDYVAHERQKIVSLKKKTKSILCVDKWPAFPTMHADYVACEVTASCHQTAVSTHCWMLLLLICKLISTVCSKRGSISSSTSPKNFTNIAVNWDSPHFVIFEFITYRTTYRTE